jgi:hypothetical protein
MTVEAALILFVCLALSGIPGLVVVFIAAQRRA